ncbi:MAG: hypothetical protein KC731_05685, partial [Myxococcales bacterium]|nr:hypothetical protein [Myxococcales bacterium]
MHLGSQRAVGVALLGLSGLLALPTFAQAPEQPPAEAKPPPTKPVPVVRPAPAASLELAARRLVQGLAPVPPGLAVGIAPLESDQPAPQADALGQKLAQLIAGKLEGEVIAATEVDALRDLAADRAGFLWLAPKIHEGRLVIGADVYRLPRTIWSRARGQAKGPLRHAAAHAPIDGEIRAYLAPVTIARSPSVVRHPGLDSDIEALACGDLDGDGDNDVVTITRQRILHLELPTEGPVARRREALWADLAPIAAVPLRQPLAFATIVEASDRAGHLDVAITDRRGSLRLDAGLSLVQRLEGKAIPHGGATACTWIFHQLLGNEARPCTDADPAPAVPAFAQPSDAMASAFVVDASGAGRTLVALRHAGTVILHDGDEERRLLRVGAQLALADLDQDGDPELATTVDTLGPRYDALDVRTLRPDGRLERRYRLPVTTGVEALAACPPDGAGPAALLVATAG